MYVAPRFTKAFEDCTQIHGEHCKWSRRETVIQREGGYTGCIQEESDRVGREMRGSEGPVAYAGDVER